MNTFLEKDQSGTTSILASSWASYVNMVSASIEQSTRVMKSGGLSQPDVAKHLQSSRASMAAQTPSI